MPLTRTRRRRGPACQAIIRQRQHDSDDSDDASVPGGRPLAVTVTVLRVLQRLLLQQPGRPQAPLESQVRGLTQLARSARQESRTVTVGTDLPSRCPAA